MFSFSFFPVIFSVLLESDDGLYDDDVGGFVDGILSGIGEGRGYEKRTSSICIVYRICGLALKYIDGNR